MGRNLDLWVPAYLRGIPERARLRRERRNRLTHVFFLICDHYEPRHKATREGQPVERVDTWRREYPKFQQRCRDAFGHAPLHTWFYPPHHGAEHLAPLADMAHSGGGEVELHYHHSNDTAETLTRDLKATLALYRRHGLLLESGTVPRTSFGFVHGDWTLDNACDGVHCGVNGELSLLEGLGCWGDFTMPSANEAQTRKINSIYYAVDDPKRHKSHDHGVDARVGQPDPRGFFLMQGPLAINWRAPGYPRIENASLTDENWGRPDRVRTWLDCGVHVKGRPDWMFIKLHTHGGVERDFDALFGEKAFQMHTTLNEMYNDGTRMKLHYVTARQAYNLAKAAERGLGGDPLQYRDLVLGRPATDRYALDVEHDLQSCTAERLHIAGVADGGDASLKARMGPLRALRGAWLGADVSISHDGGRVVVDARSSAPLALAFDRAVALEAAGDLATAERTDADGAAWRVTPRAPGPLELHFRAAAPA
jgi:hypothetical protein